jgi:hypothetical protein
MLFRHTKFQPPNYLSCPHYRKVQAAYTMVRGLRTANSKLQTQTMSKEVLGMYEEAVAALVGMDNDTERSARLANCKAPLLTAAGAQPQMRLHASVTETADGSRLVVFAEACEHILKPITGTVLQKNRAVSDAWLALVSDKGSVAALAAKAGLAKYDQWMRPLWNLSEQRHVASLYMRPEELNAVDFVDMIDMKCSSPLTATEETPWPWNPSVGRLRGVGAAGAGGADDDDGPANLRGNDFKAELLDQWAKFKSMSTTAGNEFFVTAVDLNKLPAWYWIRSRPAWPHLSEMMLYWLVAPVSTAGLERAFSFQTLIDQDTRRRRRTMNHMRDDMMVHMYREVLEKKLSTLL